MTSSPDEALHAVHVFLISFATVAVAEMGDRTQLLSLVLAARFRRPVPVILGIFTATLLNHALAGLAGLWLGKFLTPRLLDIGVGAAMLAMAACMFVPDRIAAKDKPVRYGAFLTTLLCFFVAEIGDKTELATAALAAGYSSLWPVVAGSTAGMLAANVPAVLLGHGFSARLPLKTIHLAAAILFVLIGAFFLMRGFTG